MKTLNKNKVIESLLRRIGIKTKPLAIVAAVAEKKPNGVVLSGKRVVKPVAKRPRIATKPVAVKLPPKYPNLKLSAISQENKNKINGLLKTDPVSALNLSNRLTSKVNRDNVKIKAYNSLSQIERERKVEREVTIKEAFESLTANLPRPTEVGLNVNYSEKSLLNMISKTGFDSALQAGILFMADVNQNLSVTVGAVTHKIELTDREIIEAPISKLLKWSGMGKSIDGLRSWDVVRGLGAAASNYNAVQARKKSSEYYLQSLADKVIQTEVKVKPGAMINDVLESLTLEIATQAVKMGFVTDKRKSAAFILSSDSAFGYTEIISEDLLSVMDQIISKSNVGGRLTGSGQAQNLVTGLLNKLTL